MTLMEHLTELRNRIIKSVLAIALGTIIGFFLYPTITGWLTDPYCDVVKADAVAAAAESGEALVNDPDACKLLVISPVEPLTVRMTVSAYVGIALAVPVWLWQAWRFISPGLYANERRYGAAFVSLGVALFSIGAGLAYWSIPRALDFLINIGGDDLITQFRAKEYILFAVKMMVAFGFGFQFPLLLAFLQIIGVLTPQTLSKYRRFAVVGIVVLVAVITPSGDPITLMVLSVPMYLFYEAAIIFGRLRLRSKRAEALAGTG